ncbi:unnamed protein product [Owenia fusiformis]|uniref:Nonsense-mediated mRNA decay factor SMG8 n=1 Tax=Owenia fusiformis TaxID=6347 RepID=A0A8S4N186_OWEFU|nr:unnamed protein product [Owenia fusiformis]
MSRNFTFPINSTVLNNFPKLDDKVCVVSIIGKSRYNLNSSKASILNSNINIDAFRGWNEDDTDTSVDHTCHIEGFYDDANHVIYLHFLSAYDTCSLANVCESVHKRLTEHGYWQLWQDSEHKHARALLYLFSVSHIIMMTQPGSSLDITCVRLFRILDEIRKKLQMAVGDILKDLGAPREWCLAARPCSPRVLFVFETCLLTETPGNDNSAFNRPRTQKISPLKKLQHSIEDQIYRILRKARIITNISNNSLFAVAANQEFVYVCSNSSKSVAAKDSLSFYLTQLHNTCAIPKDSDNPQRSHGYQMNRHGNQKVSGLVTLPTEMSTLPKGNDFSSFLKQHVDLALGKGFDDNVGRNPVPALFETESCELTLQICDALYEFFMIDPMGTTGKLHFNTLKTKLEVDLRFSEGRCGKILPLAENAYAEGLPQHYTRSYHQQKLAAARRVLSQHARGPASEKYLKQLEEECTRIWKSGRELCEQTSLTGNHCTNALHRLSEDEDQSNNQGVKLPVLPHASQVKTKSTCNCGRKQSEREDPFDHKAANFDFYDQLRKTCCDKLENIELPVFKPSIAEVKSSPAKPIVEEAETPIANKDLSRLDIVSGMSNLSLTMSLVESEASDSMYSHGPQGSFTTEPQLEQPQHANTEQGSQRDDSPEALGTEVEVSQQATERQHSTTEYLAGMLHSVSPPGLLPQFPSWSLVGLSKYNAYSYSQGLDQPGFLHGGNFLLPWDLNGKGDKEKWPTVAEMSTKKGKSKRGQKDQASEVNAKIYLGIEYECPRGHRFFITSPDKILKLPSGATGPPKENAAKLLNTDFPLYTACHCRSAKGYIAQLMRVFVAVPEGPVEVSLTPRVQPGPPPCPVFHPGTTSAVPLPKGKIWVLRLPFIYIGEDGPILPPTDSQHLNSCRLLKGLFTITEDSS